MSRICILALISSMRQSNIHHNVFSRKGRGSGLHVISRGLKTDSVDHFSHQRMRWSMRVDKDSSAQYSRRSLRTEPSLSGSRLSS
jgi:hypothetical protein